MNAERNIALKIALIEEGLRNIDLARAVNARLSEGERITENNVTQILTNRRTPTSAQAETIADVLRRPVADLFDAGAVVA